jgi:hypothetical protein
LLATKFGLDNHDPAYQIVGCPADKTGRVPHPGVTIFIFITIFVGHILPDAFRRFYRLRKSEQCCKKCRGISATNPKFHRVA